MKNHLLVVTRRHFLRDQESIEFKKRVEKNHVERMGNSLSFINVNETMKQIKYQISTQINQTPNRCGIEMFSVYFNWD